MNLAPSSRLCSSEFSRPLTIPLTSGLSVRLYEDCKPHCMETSALQKGLVLTLNGKELIEEGMGFGTPIVKYIDKTYFSSTSQILSQDGDSVTKRFVLDAISKKTWQGKSIHDTFYSNWRKKFAKIYLNRIELAPLFNWLMECRDLARIKTEFVKVKPRGVIDVTYKPTREGVAIAVDFSNIALSGCEELLVLNEQGSTVFDTYKDANGLRLGCAKIGGWHPVTAVHASMQNREGRIAFQLNKCREGSLFRGWERTKNRFSWAGLSYSLPPSHRIFNYTIAIKS